MSKLNKINVLALMVAVAVVLSLCSVNAKAIGLTPGRTTIDFAPGEEKAVKFTIINNEHKAFNALVYLEGDLKDAVILDKNIVEFTETDNSRDFDFRISLPEKIDTPGDHWAKVIVMEMPPGMDTEDLQSQFVIATTAVVHQVRVKVPYPGKYAELDLVVNDAEPNEDVDFFVKVFNYGTEDIYKAFATIDILGPTNEKIAIIESEPIKIGSKKSAEIPLAWKADVNPGTYHAVVTVNYDGSIARAEKNFAVGSMRIDLLDVRVRNFVLGGVAKFEIDVENKWNQRIEDVFAEMLMSKQNGDQVASFKSASADIDALQRSTLYAYWDTEGVERGAYDAKVVLNYADKTSERLLKTYVNLESIETEIVGITARAISTRGGAGPGTDYLVPIVIILVMINAGWFFYFRRKK